MKDRKEYFQIIEKIGINTESYVCLKMSPNVLLKTTELANNQYPLCTAHAVRGNNEEKRDEVMS